MYRKQAQCTQGLELSLASGVPGGPGTCLSWVREEESIESSVGQGFLPQNSPVTKEVRILGKREYSK